MVKHPRIYNIIHSLISDPVFYPFSLNTRFLLQLFAFSKIVLGISNKDITSYSREFIISSLENFIEIFALTNNLSPSSVKLFSNLLAKNINNQKDFLFLLLLLKKLFAFLEKLEQEERHNDYKNPVAIAKAILTVQEEYGVSNIINILDEVGTRGCIAVEREKIVSLFGNLRRELNGTLNEDDVDIVLTAFCQEFERRIAQKRKGRAGRGVESITSLILDHFGIKAGHAPEHFTTGLEIDKWIKTKDNWYIGISCKRTLRERWKQAYTTDLDLLSRYKIRELWHVISYDKDLSDDKLTEIGSHRAILYLPDDSPKLANAKIHPGMKNYVRPMSQFIDDLKKLL